MPKQSHVVVSFKDATIMQYLSKHSENISAKDYDEIASGLSKKAKKIMDSVKKVGKK